MPSGRVQASVSQTANSSSPAGESQSDRENGTQVPGNVYQFLRSLFPGGEIHIGEDSNIGLGTVPDHTDPGARGNLFRDAREAEPGPTDDGIFLSNLLRQIMPMISQNIAADNSSSALDRDTSFQVMIPSSSGEKASL